MINTMLIRWEKSKYVNRPERVIDPKFGVHP